MNHLGLVQAVDGLRQRVVVPFQLETARGSAFCPSSSAISRRNCERRLGQIAFGSCRPFPTDEGAEMAVAL